MALRLSGPALLLATIIAQTSHCAGIVTETNGFQLISVKKIWDRAPHNAFTDLIRFHDRWWCTFRESQAHVGGNGKIRVLTSTDAEKWEPAALLAEDGVDLRDPKLSITPDNRLMLNVGGSIYAEKMLKERQSRIAFSTEGTNWTQPQRILKKWDWLWRVSWLNQTGYGIAYTTAKLHPGADPHAGMTATLVSTLDGISYKTVTRLDIPGSPNESTVRFLANGDCVALVRREMDDKEAWVGKSSPPYKKWTWHSTGMRIGGPNFLLSNDGRLLVAGRKTDAPKSTTFVGEMSINSVTPELILPSGGDCSYPGMVLHDRSLWMSYYSSHKGKAAIYLAKIKIPTE